MTEDQTKNEKTSIQKAQEARPFASYENVGRPTVMTPETIKKLEEVFAIGGTDKEACFFANISHQTLYDYQKLHPEFVERKEALKENPILKARRTVVNSLDNPVTAQWFLERKKKTEFAQRTELTGKDGGGVIMIQIDKELANKYNLNADTSAKIDSLEPESL